MDTCVRYTQSRRCVVRINAPITDRYTRRSAYDVLCSLPLTLNNACMPAIRLRLKADTHAEARGASGSVAKGGVERAPDTCLQLLLVRPGERPICQPNLPRSPASTTVDVLGPALREHTPGEKCR